MGTQLPHPKKEHRSQNFRPCLLWPNGWMDEDATWYGSMPQPRRHCVTWRPSSPHAKRGHRLTAPNFRPMSIVAKRIDGSRCHLVGRWASTQATLCYMDTELPRKRGTAPIFGPCLLWPNGWMRQVTTWNGGRRRPRRHCVRRGPSLPENESPSQ